MDNFFIKYIDELRQVNNVEQYNLCLQSLEQMLCTGEYSSDIIQSIRMKGMYTENKFSDESTKESMLKARDSLILYLESRVHKDLGAANVSVPRCLREYLHHFYSFLEAFLEKRPHKKATLDMEILKSIQIKNEYDLQHFLYAVIKPLCTDARLEVPEDTGCELVRSDIKIPSLNTVIEAKCTRQSMSLKKLTEEIESDIVHYKTDVIYFYIYDRAKIIKNRQSFEMTFNKSFDGKAVEVVILQPVYL